MCTFQSERAQTAARTQPRSWVKRKPFHTANQAFVAMAVPAFFVAFVQKESAAFSLKVLPWHTLLHACVGRHASCR